MKKLLPIIILLCAVVIPAQSEEKMPGDPDQAFYRANAYYQSGDYSKAIETYLSIMDKDIESGNLYYNIGNGFFKLGKIGYAVMCYEKAKRLIPHDSDLKANLAYARSMAGEDYAEMPKNPLANIIELTFRDLDLNAITLIAVFFYLLAILLMAVSIANRTIARRLRIFTVLGVTAFLVTAAAFSLRYYDEEALKYGVIVQKDAECKYEPIDKSTTYYNLKEGNKAIILKTRNDWRQIKRLDGKIAWVKKEAIEPI